MRLPLSNYLLLITIYLLTACSQPTAQLPEVTQEQIEEERAHQEAFLYEADFSHIYNIPEKKKQMEERLMRISKRIGNAAIQLCKELRLKDDSGAKRRCLYDIDLGSWTDKSVNAFTDGNRITVSREMVRFLPEDEQLAFVISHEFAHSIMGHINDMANNMAAGRLLGTMLEAAVIGLGGRNGNMDETGEDLGRLAYSPEYEKEADYIGLYIMKRADYDIAKAPDVWRMLAAIDEEGIYTATTHPTSPARYALMQNTIAEIHQKQASKGKLMPEWRKERTANTGEAQWF